MLPCAQILKENKFLDFPLFLQTKLNAYWHGLLSSSLAEQEVRSSIPRLATWISEIGYLLLPSHDMAEIPLKQRKISIQPTNERNSVKCMFLYARLQTGRIMVWWCPSVRPSVCPSVRHSFPHFSPTCFDILIWNFVYHFIFMHVRSSSNAINFRHFLQELCSFLNSNSYKYAVFRTFLLHALTYWVQILYMTLF